MPQVISAFKEKPLPPIQRAFMSQYDGSVKSILSFPRLSLVLNPTFSYHNLYVSGDTEETTVTTKHTTGESEANGRQVPEEESNAYELATAVKAVFLGLPLFYLFGNEYIVFERKMYHKHKIFTIIEGEYVRIPGLTTRNCK